MYEFGAFAKETLEQLSGKGVLFTVKDGEKVNTMTIGWGSLSQYWGQEVFIAPIRESRYSYELLKGTNEFTVSVPVHGQKDEALKICGSKSGRDIDKYATCGMTLVPGKTMGTPVIEGCDIYYECRILARMEFSASNLPKEILNRWYPTEDFHTLLFGKIVAAYAK